MGKEINILYDFFAKKDTFKNVDYLMLTTY